MDNCIVIFAKYAGVYNPIVKVYKEGNNLIFFHKGATKQIQDIDNLNIDEVLKIYHITYDIDGSFYTTKKEYIKDYSDKSNDDISAAYDIYSLKFEINKLKGFNTDELIYCNLQYSFHMIVEHVLSKDYYNMGMDTYSVTNICAGDVLREFRWLKSKANMYQRLFTVLLIVNIAIFVIYLFKNGVLRI